MDLFYWHIPKWIQSAKALRSYDVIKNNAGPENCDFLRKIGENSKFRYKSFEYQVFCLYKRKMVIPTCSVSFSIIVCRYFSTWRIKMSKNWKRLHLPPHPLILTAYPTLGKVVPQYFFMKMTAKDVKEITYMPLVTFFTFLERPGKNRKGVATTPLVDEG